MKKWFHFLVSNKQNNYSPTLLQKTAMIGMACLVILSFAMSSFHTLLWQYSDWLVGTILPAVVTDLTNVERQSYSAPVLTRSTLLDEAARMKAEHMAAESYFSHYSPGGISPWFWFERVGYVYAHAGENLAVHFSDSASVVDAWMKSPTHKANIVNAKYSEIGIGVARGRYEGFDTVFVVQLFGTPAQQPVMATSTVTLDVIPERVPDSVVKLLDFESAIPNDLTTVAGLEAFDDEIPSVVANDEVSVPVPVEVVDNNVNRGLTLYEGYGQSETGELAVFLVDSRPISTVDTSQFLSLSTSSGLLPMPIKTELVSAGTSAPMMAQLATQPNTWLRFMYLGIGSLVIFSLLTSVIIGWRRHRPLEIAYGVALLAVMAGCYYLHTALTSGAVIV